MNKYEDDLELAQAVHEFSKETCEQEAPKAFRRESKWVAWILGGMISIAATANFMILNMINTKADHNNDKADITNEKIDNFYKVSTRVAVIESEHVDLKKKVRLHDVELKKYGTRLVNLEHKLKLNIVEKN